MLVSYGILIKNIYILLDHVPAHLASTPKSETIAHLVLDMESRIKFLPFAQLKTLPPDVLTGLFFIVTWEFGCVEEIKKPREFDQ